MAAFEVSGCVVGLNCVGHGFINILGVKLMKSMVLVNVPFEDEPSVS